MKLRTQAPRYAVIRLAPEAQLPKWAIKGAFWSVTRTPDELSVVIDERRVPPEVDAARGWTLFELIGPFDFDQAGILSAVMAPLAAAAIPVLTIATHDTDYLLIRAAKKARSILQQAGHQVTGCQEPLPRQP